MKEFEKMISGEIYDPNNEELVKAKRKAHRLCYQYNNTLEEDEETRRKILDELLPNSSKNIILQGPIFFDYGVNIEIGDNSYANFNFTILDTCKVKIGKNVLFGPNVAIYTPLHPFYYSERSLYYDSEKGYYTDDEYGKEVEIGDDTWVCGNVTICSGVKIGARCVIGAGSVVTRDIPSDTLAFGNPCKVIRKITEKDRMTYRK